MPVAPVSDDGVVLYYEDTGAPGASTAYVTLVLVHGTAINSGIFRPMIPYAAKNDFRLVLVNLRDYKGSTPYTDEERAAIRSSDPSEQASSLQARGLELARFMSWFIEQEQIPPISAPNEDGIVTGGISLIGWSAGNCQTLPVLAHADKFPESVRNVLGGYLRSVVMYDASMYSIGGTPPKELYNPFRAQSLTIGERVAAFPLWVSTYYPQISDLATDMPTLVATLQVRQQSTAATGDKFQPTVQTLSAKYTEDVVEIGLMDRSQLAIMGIQRSVYAENLRRALCYVEEGEKGPEVVWPNVKLQVVWCDMSHGDAVATAQMIRDDYEEMKQKGGYVRAMQMFKLEQANHFPHWDDPDRFVQALLKIV